MGQITATPRRTRHWLRRLLPGLTVLIGLWATGAGGVDRVGVAAGAGGGWHTGQSGTTQSLLGIACPSAAFCIVVGRSGTILATNNGGHSWHRQVAPTTLDLYGVSCPSPSVCYSVQVLGKVATTRDGGQSWSIQAVPAVDLLTGISCPSVSVCYAVGSTIVATTDGGRTWTTQPPPATEARPSLTGISCPSTTRCVAIGDHGTILVTTNGGQTWQYQHTAVSTSDLAWHAVTCVTASVCYAVGGRFGAGYLPSGQAGAFLLATTDGGRAWRVQPDPLQGTPHEGDFWSVGCVSVQICYAGNDTGQIVATTNGGRSWGVQEKRITVRVWSIACPGRTTCYAVGDGGTLRLNLAAGAPAVQPTPTPLTTSPVLPTGRYGCVIGAGASYAGDLSILDRSHYRLNHSAVGQYATSSGHRITFLSGVFSQQVRGQWLLTTSQRYEIALTSLRTGFTSEYCTKEA